LPRNKGNDIEEDIVLFTDTDDPDLLKF